MAVSSVTALLLIIVIAKCRSEPANGFINHNDKNDYHFGDLLKPPPPPQLPILPVPFHGGVGKPQQNDLGFQYQSLSPPQPSSIPNVSPTDFKFPAPFYKQYNFNFVPLPQPFTTTPSPTIFQKVSGWLFPSQQTSADLGHANSNYNIAPIKKDCNPCNIMPWIPVIRYDLAPNNGYQNVNPTHRPQSSIITSHFNSGHNSPQPLLFPIGNNNDNNLLHLTPGRPHANYGPPTLSYLTSISSLTSPSPTYGAPSPSHTVTIPNQQSLSPSYSSSSLYDVSNIAAESISAYSLPSSSYKALDPKYRLSSTTYAAPTSSHTHFSSTVRSPIVSLYKPELLNKHLPTQNDIELFNELEPSSELKLPKVTHPTGFRNSYGEPILNPYALNIPYSVSAAGAASSKIKTEVLPESSQDPNMTLALANPAPFSLNRGRNIHTLQPVALPNLSVSPLPPIFNARPFRPISKNYPLNNLYDINKILHGSNNVNVAKSVPIAEYTHSVEYPTTIIQSPVIDIDELKQTNQTKLHQNFQNSYVIDDIGDISPQASEDHISAANSNQDSSFESVSNDLYDSNIPLELIRYPNAPFNHKVSFADLRGIKDEDVDKYRTESNLQYIDSPLLYLKPSAPHKNYQNFFFDASTVGKVREYEIYDEIPSTTAAPQSTLTTGWDESHFTEKLTPPIAEEKDNTTRPKIVQIIVPYTSGQNSNYNENIFSFKDLYLESQEKFQARKIQSNTENNLISVATEKYNDVNTTTEEGMSTVTDNYASERSNTPTILTDTYDVKEPPFDIIKLQHTIDDWTEQEYSKLYSTPQRTRSSENYSKQIPDDFFTTNSPSVNYPSENRNYNFDLYDHEGSSSIQHTVTENGTNTFPIKRKEYNTIERTRNKFDSSKNEDSGNIKKLHIYTAASTFRSTTTTTPAPWGQIQTSISPLTNEKVYVVTSKPWQEKNMAQEYDYEIDKVESERTETDANTTVIDNLPFKSPRFTNRPSYGFTAGTLESVGDSPYGFSKGWYRRINNLEYPTSMQDTSIEEESDKDLRTTKVDDENT